MQHASDSSIEEILESIKKVIARDNREAAMVERKLRETRGMAERKTASEVMDEAMAEDEILDLGTSATAFIDGDEPQIAEPDASLTSHDAKESMRQSFAALSMIAGPSNNSDGEEQGGSALEGMVREMMRPMLADWLDENLPAIVERLVRDEIDMIAGKKR